MAKNLLRWLLRFFTVLVLLWVAVALAWYGRGYWLYPKHPTPLQQELAVGVSYQRLLWQQPRSVVLHLLSFDLEHSGLQLFVTPPNSDGRLSARRTSAFLQEFEMEFAINGSFFYPFVENIFNSYPQSNEPVTAVGLNASNGSIYGTINQSFHSFYVDQQQRIFMQSNCQTDQEHPNCQQIDQAIAGKEWILWDGEVTDAAKRDQRTYPRTIVAVDHTRQQLWWLVVDGKQPRYSEGLTLLEAAQLLQSVGAVTALNLDGGGSTTLVRADVDKGFVLMNSPIHQHIPGRERIIANHLGLRKKID